MQLFKFVYWSIGEFVVLFLMSRTGYMKPKSRSAHPTPNFANPECFVCLLFEYFFQIKVLNWYQNKPKNDSISRYIKKKKPLCNNLNRGNWNSGFVKLGFWWAERDTELVPWNLLFALILKIYLRIKIDYKMQI